MSLPANNLKYGPTATFDHLIPTDANEYRKFTLKSVSDEIRGVFALPLRDQLASARDPDTDPEMLRQLIQGRHKTLFKTLLARQDLHPDLLFWLAQHLYDEDRLDLVLRHPNTPLAVLREKAGGVSGPLQDLAKELLAQRQPLSSSREPSEDRLRIPRRATGTVINHTSSELHYVFNTPEISRKRIGHGPLTHPYVLRLMARTDQWITVKRQLAANPKLRRQHLRTLSKSIRHTKSRNFYIQDSEVRRGMNYNPTLSPITIHKLATGKGTWARNYALNHSQIATKTLKTVYPGADPEQLRRIAIHSGTPLHILEEMTYGLTPLPDGRERADFQRSLHGALGRNPSLPPACQAHIAQAAMLELATYQG